MNSKNKIKNMKLRELKRKSEIRAKWDKIAKEIWALNIRIPGNDAVKFLHKNR